MKRKITIKKTDEATLKEKYNLRTEMDWGDEVKAAAELEAGYDFEIPVPERLTTKEQKQGHVASLKRAIVAEHPALKKLVKVSLSKDEKFIMVRRLAPDDAMSEDELKDESNQNSEGAS